MDSLQVWGGPGSGGWWGEWGRDLTRDGRAHQQFCVKIGRLEFSYFESEGCIQSDLAVSLL